jgi:hypothetical protein
MAKKSVLKALLKYAPKSVEGKIEAAAYADGHAIIANKFEEAGGNMRLAFDVKHLAAPDAESQRFMNQVNGLGMGSEEEPEPVPASRGNTGETAKAAAAAPPQGGAVAPQGAPAPQADGNGISRRGGSLFPADEAADLSGGSEPPAFR